MGLLPFLKLFSAFSTGGTLPSTTIHDLPRETIQNVLYHLSLKDQLTLMSTCKEFHKIPCALAKLQTPQPKPPISDFAIASLFMTVTAAALIYEFWGTTEQSDAIACAVAGFVILCHQLPKRLTEEKLRTTRYTKQLTQQLRKKTVTINKICIDYYEKLQANSLIEAASKCNIPDVEIRIYTSPKHPLKLYSLLADNIHLTTLNVSRRCTDSLDDPDTPHDRFVCIDSLRAGLMRNKHLTKLTLHYITLTHSLLDTLFINSTIKDLALTSCSTQKTYSFAALEKNSTLEKLALINFTNQYTRIDNSMVPHFLNFMQHNTKLKHLSLFQQAPSR